MFVAGAGVEPKENVGAVVDAVVVVVAPVPELGRDNPKPAVVAAGAVFPRVSVGLLVPPKRLGVGATAVVAVVVMVAAAELNGFAPNNDVVAGAVAAVELAAAGVPNKLGVEVPPRLNPVEVLPVVALPKRGVVEVGAAVGAAVEEPNKGVHPIEVLVLLPNKLGVVVAGLGLPNKDIILK